MGEVLGRLLPAVRDIRTPLAVGYSWLILVWAAARQMTDGRMRDDELVLLYRSMTDGVPDLAMLAATTFVAVLLGSGVVRLMDRFMQALPSRGREKYNPLDIGRENLISEYVEGRCIGPQAKREWGGTDSTYLEDDYRLFRFHLQQDQDFGALQAEQLLRFSMIFPLTIGVGLSIVWWQQADDLGPGLLSLCLALLVLIAYADYMRTGTLLKRRWRTLVEEYPTWLPMDAQTRRESTLSIRLSGADDRVWAALNESGAGIRSIAALEQPDRVDERREALSRTAVELDLAGARELGDLLREVLGHEWGANTTTAALSARDTFYREVEAYTRRARRTPEQSPTDSE